ncbi:Putative RxLR effector [Phytophthora palmivora]|uniref:RxLR effector protein n=1 Tax=Phytophthora palmivora TaxID=4796 RepID=A0A2P4YTJ9_9STRA|nr:Putative RxLR effector [Phytophthora palmivora]
MRLFHILVVIGATILASSGAYSTTMDANQFEIFKAASPSGSNQRLLRAHQTTVNLEERGLLKPKDETILSNLAKKLKIDPTKYDAQLNPEYPKYMEKTQSID